MNDANTADADAVEGALVLVVDDDNATRIMAREYLMQGGFRVLEAEDGLMALEVLETHTPDVIVLDVEMPRLDGFAVCTELRKRAHLIDTPVLMLTSLNYTNSIDLAFDARATDFATKPINWSLLRHRLRYLLRAATANAQIQSA